MHLIKAVRTALAALLAAALATALAASTAAATEVTPAGGEVAAASAETRFILANAYGPLAVICTTNTAKLTIPTEGARKLNQNKTAIGKFSGGPGSVSAPFTERPRFETCEVRNLETGKTEAKATVTTNETNGKWLFAAVQLEAAKEENDKRVGMITVPKAGATIPITTTTCELTVSPEGASVVSGEWTNGANSEAAPSTLKVDGQIGFAQTAGCAAFGLESPAQFEGTYSAKTVPASATPVKVSR